MTDSGYDDLTRTGPGGGSKVDEVKEGASHAAHDMRDEVSGTVSDVKAEASAQLGHVKDEVMGHANDLLVQTRTQAVAQADQGTHQFAQSLVAAGRELSAMASRSEQPDGPMTALVRQIGERATSMGQRFEQGGYRSLKGEVTGYARSSPGMFLLAAVGAGFAVGRVVRNADTRALADAARGQQGGNSQGSGPEAVGPGSQVPESSMAATAVIPSDLDLREPPGVGPDELTGLASGGATPAGAEPGVRPGGTAI